MPTPAHILFLCDYYPPAIGGIEVVNKALSELHARDTKVTVCTQRTHGAPALSEKDNVRLVRVSCPMRSLFPLFAWNTARKLAKEADIIHVSPYASSYLAGLLMPFVRKPFVLHVHGFLGKDLSTSLYGKLFAQLVIWYERLFFFLPWQKIVCVSEGLKGRLQKDRVIRDAQVIHNGIDTQLFHPQESDLREKIGLAKDATVFVYAGRPSPLKGTDLILGALPALLEREPNLHMAFFVPSDDTKNWGIFQKTLQGLKNHERIHLFEAQPHSAMPKVYAMADLVLIPSRSEGFCFQAVEACAMGVPVLCPRRDAFPEVVSGKVIFIDELSVAAVQEGMERFLQKAWEEIPAKDFSWDRALVAWKTLYASLLG